MVCLQRLYHVDDNRTLDLVDELELEKDEDAPMSMTAHPDVNPYVHSKYTTINFACRINNSYAGLTALQLSWRKGRMKIVAFIASRKRSTH